MGTSSSKGENSLSENIKNKTNNINDNNSNNNNNNINNQSNSNNKAESFDKKSDLVENKDSNKTLKSDEEKTRNTYKQLITTRYITKKPNSFKHRSLGVKSNSLELLTQTRKMSDERKTAFDFRKEGKFYLNMTSVSDLYSYAEEI